MKDSNFEACFSPSHLPTKERAKLENDRRWIKQHGFKPYTVFYGGGYKKIYCDCTKEQRHILDALIWSAEGHLRQDCMTPSLCAVNSGMDLKDLEFLLQSTKKVKS